MFNRQFEVELRDLYGEVGYTIIDDVLSLPERCADYLSAFEATVNSRTIKSAMKDCLRIR